MKSEKHLAAVSGALRDKSYEVRSGRAGRQVIFQGLIQVAASYQKMMSPRGEMKVVLHLKKSPTFFLPVLKATLLMASLLLAGMGH